MRHATILTGLGAACLGLLGFSCDKSKTPTPPQKLAAPAQAAPPPAAAEESADHVEVALRHVLWQALPPEIEDVWIAPDHRLWYRRHTGGLPHAAADIRRAIEREFRKDGPQIYGVEPVLFEPGGRVWFLVDQWDSRVPQVLMGFDGQTWVERTFQPPRRFAGHVPGHNMRGQHVDLFSPACVDGVAFFADYGGVHGFDGKEWTYLDFKLETRDYRYIDLVPLADGKTLVAYLAGGKAPVRVWRAGRWEEMPLPPSIPDGLVYGAALADEGGVWLFPHRKGFDYWPIGAGLPPDFAAALRRLGDPDTRVRDAATDEMARGDVRVLRLAERAAREQEDPTIRRRLEQVVQVMTARGVAPGRLGPYALSEPRLARRGAAGEAYVYANDLGKPGGGPPGPGLVVALRGGRVFAVTDPEYVDAWKWNAAASDGWPVDSGRRLWMPGTEVGQPARLVDAEDGRTVLIAPDSRFACLHAVLPDGTAFLSIRGPLNSRLVGVCRPGAPDDGHPLAAETCRVRAAAVGPDGALWAQQPREGIVRFDGARWQPVAALDEEKYARWMVAGRGGTLLVRGDRSAAFLKDGTARRAPDVRALVEACRADVAEAFSASGAPVYGEGDAAQIVADKAGRLWLLDDHRLGVRADGGWLEPEAAAGVEPAKLHRLAAVGDGSKVFLAYGEYDAKGRNSFLGEVRDGRLAFSPAPCSYVAYPGHPTVRDQAGALWVHAWVPKGPEEPAGEIEQRVTQAGVIATHRDAGDALLCDQGGNVWLRGPTQQGDRNRIEIWRDGRCRHAVDLPASWPHNVPMVSDRPGSRSAASIGPRGRAATSTS